MPKHIFSDAELRDIPSKSVLSIGRLEAEKGPYSGWILYGVWMDEHGNRHLHRESLDMLKKKSEKMARRICLEKNGRWKLEPDYIHSNWKEYTKHGSTKVRLLYDGGAPGGRIFPGRYEQKGVCEDARHGLRRWARIDPGNEYDDEMIN